MRERFGMSHKSVNLGGHNLHYLESSHGEIPLVFIHGLLDSSFGFRKLIQHIPREYRVFILDIPGFGKSRMPHVKYLYQVDIFADLVYEALLHMQLDNVVMAGHSMGGLITAHMAANDRLNIIRKIILISTTVDPHPERDQMRKLLFPATEEEITGLLKFLYYENFPEPNQLLKNALVHLCNSPPYQYLADNTIAREKEIFFGNVCKNIKIPALVIAGENDTITTPAMMKKLKGYLKQGKLVLVPNARHAVHMEKPHDLAKEIANFMKV